MSSPVRGESGEPCGHGLLFHVASLVRALKATAAVAKSTETRSAGKADPARVVIPEGKSAVPSEAEAREASLACSSPWGLGTQDP